jgi:hypothetical protein
MLTVAIVIALVVATVIFLRRPLASAIAQLRKELRG